MHLKHYTDEDLKSTKIFLLYVRNFFYGVD